MKNKCVKLQFNFVQRNDGEEAGEDYHEHEVGHNKVVNIERHSTQVHDFFTVKFEEGREEIIYNPNRAFFEGDE